MCAGSQSADPRASMLATSYTIDSISRAASRDRDAAFRSRTSHFRFDPKPTFVAISRHI
jgi:hypothetical protein